MSKNVERPRKRVKMNRYRVNYKYFSSVMSTEVMAATMVEAIEYVLWNWGSATITAVVLEQEGIYA